MSVDRLGYTALTGARKRITITPHTMPRPPLVAITATSEIIRDALRIRLNNAYVDAVAGAGALPFIIPPLADVTNVAGWLDVAEALVLTGGEDVDPARYGAAPHSALGDINAARDATEIALVAAARTRHLPTLAICRGMQVLNVALGGTLVQDIPSERPGALVHVSGPRDARLHDVGVDQGSRLAQALGATHLRTNSSHHQSLAVVADGLRATAYAADGIVEGAEWTDDAWWAVGVQWHPEELVHTGDPWDRALFAALLAEAQAYRALREMASA